VSVSRHVPQNHSTGLLDSGKFCVLQDSSPLGYCALSLVSSSSILKDHSAFIIRVSKGREDEDVMIL